MTYFGIREQPTSRRAAAGLMPWVAAVARATAKAERVREQAKIGRLSESLVSEIALRNYKVACALFFQWLAQQGLAGSRAERL